MNKVKYRALVQSGKIQTFTDLVNVRRKEIIDIYNSRTIWPYYKPTRKETQLEKRIYIFLNLSDIVPFQTYIYIVNHYLPNSLE
jgi:hypothetical protein